MSEEKAVPDRFLLTTELCIRSNNPYITRGARCCRSLLHEPNATNSASRYERPARAAHQAGEGARLHLVLGGRSGVAGDRPLEALFEAESLSAGQLVFGGPMLNGVKVELGSVACLRIDDVRVIVSSVKSQMLDRNLYRVAGIQPEAMKILVNKSSMHFRADFEPIAEKILIAKVPGPMAADPADYPWMRLTPGIRTSPGGKAFAAQHRP